MRLAIVDDDQMDAQELFSLLLKYAESHALTFDIAVYSSAFSFLSNYKASFDLIFLDIDMPYMDGIHVAEKIRGIDSVTPLFFVSGMAHMAVQGYSVQAFAFLTKPLNAAALSMQLDRLRRSLADAREIYLVFSSGDKTFRLSSQKITYIEVQDHHLIYHTLDGDYQVYSTLKTVAQQLSGAPFALCNNCYLVNLKYVQRICDHTVWVNNAALQISHPRKKAFLQALNQHIGC